MKLVDLIPKEELEQKLSYGDSELEPDFLCFENNYEPVARIVPKEFTIVDMGCYQAAQCYLFAKHKLYVGVDCYEKCLSERYAPPMRFQAENTVHIVSTINFFISRFLRMFDLSKTYFIASAVPDFTETETLLYVTKNCLVSYPGKQPKTKGVYAKEIEEAVKNYKWRQI